MSNQEPFEIVQQVLRKASGANWDDKNRLKTEFAEYLTDDLFDGEYELVNVAANVRVAGTFWHDVNQVEITVQGFGLPYRALLLRGSDGRWRMKSFLMQCSALAAWEQARSSIIRATHAVERAGASGQHD